MTLEAQKQKAVANARIRKEKQKGQLTEDLNSMGKSFANHFKRLEKQKEVVKRYLTVKNP